LVLIDRIRQFFKRLRRVRPEYKVEVIQKYLTEQQRSLFDAMPLALQNHSVKVLETLVRQGHTDRDLLSAALLHDVGKPQTNLPLCYGVLFVLFERFFPSVLRRIASPQPGKWRYVLYGYLHHSEIGAELLANANGSQELVELVRMHHEQPNSEKQRALFFADRMN